MNGTYTKYEGKRGTTWHGRYSYVDPVTNRRLWKRVAAPTKKACQQKVNDALAKINAGETPKDEKITVRVFAGRWLAAITPTVRPSTLRRYRDAMTNHVLPALGDTRLTKLTALDLQSLYANRIAAGLSTTTVNSLHAVIHRALRQAVQWDMLDRNVASLAEAPRPRELPVITWSAAEAGRVLAAADTTPLAALWRLAILCGLRRGELLGLRWDDADLKRGTLSIQRTISRGEGGSWVVGEPKTKKSRRQIALPASCVLALTHQRDRQTFDGGASGPVFTGVQGGPLPVNSLARSFAALIDQAGVPKLRFHDLRHGCATLLLAEGTHPRLVADLLGHGSTAITMSRYSHVTPSMSRQVAGVLDAALAASQTEIAKDVPMTGESDSILA